MLEISQQCKISFSLTQYWLKLANILKIVSLTQKQTEV